LPKDFNEIDLSQMLKSLLRDRKLPLFFALALVIRLFSLQAAWVERYYTYGLYPLLSRIFRALLGWIPFSVGDVLYAAAFLYLVVKTAKFLRILARRQVKEYLSHVLMAKLLRLVLGIYIFFNLAWGLNYDRLGIASQLQLDVKPYTKADLNGITGLLAQRLNGLAVEIDSVQRETRNRPAVQYSQALKDYEAAAKLYPFLAYHQPSTKTSLYSGVGHYFGFSGYINPFTGEAQINTTEPVFVKPFVINHEIAHQLGYGKENEASFVSFLVSRGSASVETRYSLYYELFFDALAESRLNGDTVLVKQLRQNLHPRVLADKLTEIRFRTRNRNALQPYVTGAYDRYLRLNNQPGGMATYNQVIAWLIAFAKKRGAASI